MIEFKEVYQTNHMRIGNTTNNEYFLELNQINDENEINNNKCLQY